MIGTIMFFVVLAALGVGMVAIWIAWIREELEVGDKSPIIISALVAYFVIMFACFALNI